MLKTLLPFVALAGLAEGARPLHAEQTDEIDARVAAMIEDARAVTTAVPPRKRCEPGNGDEIVVCAQDNGDRYRVPSSIESNPGSRAALDTGIPSAPQFDRGSCRGQPGCMVGGWAPPPVYAIDLKALPEAPEGSEADQIAKGEKAAR